MNAGLHPQLETLLDFFQQQVDTPPTSHTHAAGLIEAPNFFSVEAFQSLLNNPLLSPEWVFLKNRNQPLSLEQCRSQKDVQSKQLHFLDKRMIETELNNGGALVLEGIDILDPMMNLFAGRLDNALPCSFTNGVAFFSQSGNEAYEGHIDSDDVLVIQISGEKRWHLFEPQQRRYANTDNLSTAQLGPEAAQLTMGAGDALYLRAGVPHRCDTLGSHSLHLAFDLVDSTPNPKQITDEANRLYEQASEVPYAPAAKAMERYIEILQSADFQKSLKLATLSVREDIMQFRKVIRSASDVTALSKYI